MADLLVTRVVGDLLHMARLGAGRELGDRELLDRFARDRDHAAFELLVHRHAGMVLAVCRQVLRHEQDAEDAFQAAFVVLARKGARSVRDSSAAGWLFRVAQRVACRLKARRGPACVPVDEVAAVERGSHTQAAELRELLEHELGRLPDHYRLPLLMCGLEGQSRDEVARRLGWRPGTLKIRLERARALLRSRLARRGLGMVGLPAALLTPEAQATVPAELIHSAVQQATCSATPSFSSNPIQQLARGVLQTMMIERIRAGAVGLLALVAVVLGLLAGRASERPPEQAALPVPHEERLHRAVPLPDEINKPIRVLLVAGGPTREFQFVRSLLLSEAERARVELSVYLQTGGLAGVLEERTLAAFPPFERPEQGKPCLQDFDVILGFDPDWSKLDKALLADLEKWVRQQGGGFMHVAGLVNTYQPLRGANRERCQLLLDLLPVELEDCRVRLDLTSAAARRWQFTKEAEEQAFLRLAGDRPLSGWDDFFGPADKVLRGFHTSYPTIKARPAAKVLATIDVPPLDNKAPVQTEPSLVMQPYGKGRVLYVSVNELWRLRTYQQALHERFWGQTVRFLARRPALVPADVRPLPGFTDGQSKAIDRAVNWLAKNQHRDGHWEGQGGSYPVLLTAQAGLALLMSGSTISDGPHSDHLRRALEYLTDRSKRNGLIGNPNNPNEAVRYMYGHAYALAFLACIHGEEVDADQRGKIAHVLEQAVAFAGASQSTKGGWGYVAAAEGNDFASVPVTLGMLHGLQLARQAGIDVPKKLTDGARQYLINNANVNSAQLPALLALLEPDEPTARKWLAREGLEEIARAREHGLGSTELAFLHALLAHRLGGDGHLKLVPERAPRDLITWQAFRQRRFEDLFKSQQQDGSWQSPVGNVHGTALSLAILQLERSGLPGFTGR